MYSRIFKKNGSESEKEKRNVRESVGVMRIIINMMIMIMKKVGMAELGIGGPLKNVGI